VLVDQFEEIFRLDTVREDSDSGEDEAAGFVRLLLEAIGQRDVPVYVALTMRSDLLGDCARFRDLPKTLNRAQYLIPRMTREQRREAFEGTVAVGGATIAPALVQRLLNDVGDDPDQLPILQHALMSTWEAWEQANRLDQPVDFEHYDQIGTLANALKIHADEAFAELDQDGQRIAKRLFQCLAEKAYDRRATRHPTRVREICAIAAAPERSMISVIDCFRSGGRMFLVPPEPEKLNPESVVDISHESLIRLWERMKEWVDEEAKSAELYRRFETDAAIAARPRRRLSFLHASVNLLRRNTRRMLGV
jgi:hypothetical protein